MEETRNTLTLQNIENLVFQGGSVKCIAYGGGVAALENAFTKIGKTFDTQIKNVGGTSAGAIVALALSLGADSKELVDIIGKTDFKSFLDENAFKIVKRISDKNESSSEKIKRTSAALRSLSILKDSHGLSSGQQILSFLEDFVKKKSGFTNLTFEEHRELVIKGRDNEESKKKRATFKNLFVVAFNLSLGETKVFSYIETPKSIISDAVRCSMSIPFVFVYHKNYIKFKSDDIFQRVPDEISDVFIDGGITENYPIWLFDRILHTPFEATLGFYLVSETEKCEMENNSIDKTKKRKNIENLYQYTMNVLEAIVSHQQTSSQKHSNNIKRTVYIDHLGISSLKFELTSEEKNKLINSGWNCTLKRCQINEEEYCPLKIKTDQEDDSESKREEIESGPSIKKCFIF